MRKRKKWEPVYRFGGNPRNFDSPNPLGENTSPYTTKNKNKRGKRK